jgi:hypothetical protein
MTARRFNSLLVFTVLGIIFSPKIFIRAQELTSGVPGKYLSASCAIFCSQCMKGIDVYGQGLSALCGKKNYEGIDACRLKCLEYEHPRVVGVALTLSLDCQSCLKESKCLNEQKKNFCQAIEKGRDMVEVSQYTRLKKIGAVPEGSTFGCPIGAEFSAETQKCQCPEGKELDSLHTVG